MPVQSLTLNIPDPLHRWLKERAARSQRSMEEETLDVLGAAVPNPEALPPDVVAAVDPLPMLDDQSLWRAARARLADDAAGRLADLHDKRQRQGLTADEDQLRVALVRQYERAMLVRAEATAELLRRGHDVSGPVTP